MGGYYGKCSPLAPPIHSNMESYDFKANKKLKMALTQEPISGLVSAYSQTSGWCHGTIQWYKSAVKFILFHKSIKMQMQHRSAECSLCQSEFCKRMSSDRIKHKLYCDQKEVVSNSALEVLTVVICSDS